MNKLKYVLTAAIGLEFIFTLLILFVINEMAWSVRRLFTYDRLTVFIYTMLILFVWNIFTHYKILKNIRSKTTIGKNLINYHLIVCTLISACLAFIVSALSTADKTVTFELEDILLGISVFTSLVLANWLISLKMNDHNKSLRV